MKIAVGLYAALLLVGGVIGYLMAGSSASLAMGTACALLFGVLASQKGKMASYATFGLTLLLLLFFGYRFALAFKFMPAGLMALVSLLLTLKLGSELFCAPCCNSDKGSC
jgi:uncharacterized membrane protein (UPF0136 family)